MQGQQQASQQITIATWNLNSLNKRLEQVLNWLEVYHGAIDILAIQETKTEDQNFPTEQLEKAGYSVVFSGQKAYNGVAILSRTPAADVRTDIELQTVPQEKRIIAATIQGIRIINLYVINGSDVSSPKYQNKLQWLAEVNAFIKEELARYPHCVVLGDLNIAPADRDVYEPSHFAGDVPCSEPERERFKQMLELGLVDTFRLFEQTKEKYSWWDYRRGAFNKDHGLRIDHILASTPLAEHCNSSTIDRTPRGWEGPSDHAPVIAAFSYR